MKQKYQCTEGRFLKDTVNVYDQYKDAAIAKAEGGAA